MKIMILSHQRCGSTFLYSLIHRHVCPNVNWHFGNNMLHIERTLDPPKFYNKFYDDYADIEFGYDRLYNDIKKLDHVVNKCHFSHINRLRLETNEQRCNDMVDLFDYKILLKRNPFDIALSAEIWHTTRQTGDWGIGYDYSNITKVNLNVDRVIEEALSIRKRYINRSKIHKFDEVVDYDVISKLHINEVFPSLKLSQYYPLRHIDESNLKSNVSPDKRDIIANYDEIMEHRKQFNKDCDQ